MVKLASCSYSRRQADFPCLIRPFVTHVPWREQTFEYHETKVTLFSALLASGTFTFAFTFQVLILKRKYLLDSFRFACVVSKSWVFLFVILKMHLYINNDTPTILWIPALILWEFSFPTLPNVAITVRSLRITLRWTEELISNHGNCKASFRNRNATFA